MTRPCAKIPPLHEPRICRTAPETGMVRSRALQRGRGTVPPCPEVRAEALDYEPHVRKVQGPNARQKGVEATHEPVDTASPLTFVLSPAAGERKCASRISGIEKQSPLPLAEWLGEGDSVPGLDSRQICRAVSPLARQSEGDQSAGAA